MTNVLITGASRGIGLGLTKKFLQDGSSVVAACRNPDGARDLWEVESDYKGRVQIVECDVGDEGSIQALGKELAQCGGIDVLINNDGVLEEPAKGLAELSIDKVRKSFEINVVGAMQITRMALPYLQKSARPIVVSMTSKMGSITDNTSGFAYAYRISKAALNMFNRSLAVEFPNIICTVLHPGWVQTAMGGPNALIDVYESVAGLTKVIGGLTLKQSGKFYDFNGKEIPW